MKRTKKAKVEEPVEELEINELEAQDTPVAEPVELRSVIPFEELVKREAPVEVLEVISAESLRPTEPVEPVEKIIRWKKVGGSTFILNNRMIKPGQVFTAKVSEIPKAFRDLIIPVDDLPVEVDELTLIGDGSSFSLQPNGDKWNILNRLGKKLNEVALSRDEALILIKQLL